MKKTLFVAFLTLILALGGFCPVFAAAAEDAPLLILPTPAVQSGYTCSDWARPHLEKAEALGLIPDSLAAADMTKLITREEFAAVSVALYEAMSGAKADAVPAADAFKDCDDPAVLKACALGITNGMGGDLFCPADNLTREQAATMLTRVYKSISIEGWTLEKDDDFYALFQDSFQAPLRFKDESRFQFWAVNSIHFMRARSIIDGVGGNEFAPSPLPENSPALYGLCTREQALKIAVRMKLMLEKEDFAPMNAYLADSVNGCSLYAWKEGDEAVVAFYDADGSILDQHTAPLYFADENPGVLINAADYSGWYIGAAGLYRLEDGHLLQSSARPVKDLCFLRVGAGASGPILLGWWDLENYKGFFSPADTIENGNADGTGAGCILLSPMDGAGIPIDSLSPADSVIHFRTMNDQGMAHFDEAEYALISAPGGVPYEEKFGDRKSIVVVSFTAGRPEVMPGFTWEDPDGYIPVWIKAEQERLNGLGLGI